LKVTQLRDICHKFTAATARCQDHRHHHHDHHVDDRHGRCEGQSPGWGVTSFSPCQFEYNGFTGDKNWAPSNTFHIPNSKFHSIGACISFQSWSSDFPKRNIFGGRMVLSLRLVQLLLLLRSLYCDDLEIETTRLRVFHRR